MLACGVRKIWKKEFEGLDKASQQVERLHSILGDLGMTPRYSLEKAKAIREQRELAQELSESRCSFNRIVSRLNLFLVLRGCTRVRQGDKGTWKRVA